jgi:glutaredoxin
MIRVTLYGKPGCHLCDEAKHVLGDAWTRHPFELEEVDITRDPELERVYRERIPVIAIDGEEVLELRIDPQELEQRLARVAP